MALRVAVGGLGHETNTYADASLGRTTLDSFLVARGERVAEVGRGRRSYLGGMFAAADELGIEAVPTVWAYAQPSGTIEASAYRTLRDELVRSIAAAAPVAGVCLEMHGGAVAEGVDDVEADLVAAVRRAVGDVPITATLDLHGNVTDAMAQRIDAMFGTQLYPHTDTFERGHEAMSLVPRLVEGTVRPVTAVEHLPILLPASTTDAGHPAARMNEMCAKIEEHPQVLDCTVFHGLPQADTPWNGVHVVVTTDGDRDLADKAAGMVAGWVWQHRGDFLPEMTSPVAAVREAAAADGPVVINETSDNPGGGAPGDGTHLLRAMLDAGLEDACFAMVCDPDTVRRAVAMGVGAEVDVRLGGRHDDLHGPPVEANAYVHSLSDGKVTLRAPEAFAGVTFALGPMCRLRIGGVDVVVSSLPSQTFDPEVFLLHGIDVTRYRTIGLKGGQHFRSAFAGVTDRFLTADGPGLTSLRVDAFPRTRATRPLWPIDPAAAYP